MPEPQPGARPADGSTPGAEPSGTGGRRRADLPTRTAGPAGTLGQPEPPDQPDQPRTPDQPDQDSDQPEPAAHREVPAPRWSGSAPVPPPLPRRPAWGESAEPTPPPPVPVGPPEHQTPVDPWAGVDTGGWDLPSAELPPLPPTLPYPRRRRPGSGPGRPPAPAGPHPVPHAGRPGAAAGRPERTAGRRAHDAGPADVAARTAPAPPRSCRSSAGAGDPTAPPSHRRCRRRLAGPQGVLPVPVRRRRRWPWLLLLTLACCCGCPAYYGFADLGPVPGPRGLPAQVDDLSLRQDERQRRGRPEVGERGTQGALAGRGHVRRRLHHDDGKRVTVFGGTGFRLSPESDAEAEIGRLTERYALGRPETVDTGVRGRHERCAVGSADGSAVVVCTSVDHGSIATGVFTRLSVADSADLLATLRAQIVQPERG